MDARIARHIRSSTTPYTISPPTSLIAETPQSSCRSLQASWPRGCLSPRQLRERLSSCPGGFAIELHNRVLSMLARLAFDRVLRSIT